MAIPKSLKPIPNEKALQLIKKHLKAGTGEYESYPDLGDFIYKTGKGYYLLRKNFSGTLTYGNNTYEKGKVCL